MKGATIIKKQCKYCPWLHLGECNYDNTNLPVVEDCQVFLEMAKRWREYFGLLGGV
jgi:hypothetical protein